MLPSTGIIAETSSKTTTFPRVSIGFRPEKAWLLQNLYVAGSGFFFFRL
ncbi:MAG: hypothetical protein ACJAVO_001580 [Parvibaculaceae bacterium]|jgi:hypothetical protein